MDRVREGPATGARGTVSWDRKTSLRLNLSQMIVNSPHLSHFLRGKLYMIDLKE